MKSKEKSITDNNIEITIKSSFNVTIDEIRNATSRFEKEGSSVKIGNNRKGIAGILKNRYHRARTQAVDIVAACKE